MWCVALLVFGFLRQTLGAPAEMQPVGKNKTTFNIAMLSGLGYVAVLAKYQVFTNLKTTQVSVVGVLTCIPG
ncbi:unnamed protein product [Strongylus vulgaris]|uniref:Uncharacterized protein n=1 Tax=Strongylus vulgaris TaxID=40348 RepID=A0A3P7JH44_STRVU|nr:unnamed protein product [Strongylus vulgaris]